MLARALSHLAVCDLDIRVQYENQATKSRAKAGGSMCESALAVCALNTTWHLIACHLIICGFGPVSAPKFTSAVRDRRREIYPVETSHLARMSAHTFRRCYKLRVSFDTLYQFVSVLGTLDPTTTRTVTCTDI